MATGLMAGWVILAKKFPGKFESVAVILFYRLKKSSHLSRCKGPNFFTFSLQKSKPWIVCLLDNNVIDFSEGEPRSTVLRLDDSLTPLSAASLHSFSIKMRHNANVTVPFTVSYTKNPLDAKTGIVYAAVLLIGLYLIIIFDVSMRSFVS